MPAEALAKPVTKVFGKSCAVVEGRRVPDAPRLICCLFFLALAMISWSAVGQASDTIGSRIISAQLGGGADLAEDGGEAAGASSETESASGVVAVVNNEMQFAGLPSTLIVTAGCVALALAMALLLLRSHKNARRSVHRWHSRFAMLEAKLDRAETIFNAQPDLVIVWDEDGNQPAEGWGRPKVLGNPATLATLVSYADKADGITPVENILDGLSKQVIQNHWVGGATAEQVVSDEGGPPPSLIEAVQDLRWNGTSFAVIVRGRDGREIEVQGRPAGAQAVVWLTDVTAKAQTVGVLRDRLLGLRDETQQLRKLLDEAPFPVWRRDDNLKLAWVNKAYADAVSMERPEDVVNREAELDKTSLALTHRAQETGSTESEKRYVVIDGARRALDMIEIPHDGGYVGMALDITGKDDAEKELQRHVDAHVQTLDKLATAVAIFGPDKKLQFYNQAYAKCWDLDPAWLDSNPADGEILDRLREKRLLPEQADFKGWKERRLDLYMSVTEQPDELWHLPDARHLRVACQPHPMGGLLFLYEDVTDRFRLESSLNTLTKVQRAMLDNLSEGVAVFGSNGKLELHNKSFVEIWQLQQVLLEKQPHFTRVVDWCKSLFDDDSEWMRMAERVTSFNEERHPLAGRLERKDGSFVDYAILPLPNGASLLTCLDVTDTTRITKALRERNEALEAADKLKSEFISHVSYQLRTPLTSIKGFAEMLDGEMVGELSKAQHDYTDSILQASNQLTVLTDDILDLANIEAGVMTLDLADVDLYQTLANAHALAKRQAADTGTSVELNVDEEIGTLHADDRRLRQIVYNLVANAISFTGEGGKISIGAERSGPHVRIWVEDTGAGIEPKDQATVFDRFESRGHGGRRRGPGLGLSLVRSFVELHGGWVALESEPNVGTKVICHLPVKAETVVDLPHRDKDAAE